MAHGYSSSSSGVSALFHKVKAPLIARLLPVSVNGEQVSRRHILAEGDLVNIILPITGR